jgi:hypothetical protein
MLEILECKNTKKYDHILENTEAKEKLYVVEACDKEKVNGYAIYGYSEDKVLIYDFECSNDLYLCDGIIRSVLLKATLKGIDIADFIIEDFNKIKILKALKFVGNNDKKLFNIMDFMNNCKKCKEIS